MPPFPSIARSLLASCDPVIVGKITDAMKKFAITSDVCTDIESAYQLINTRKFDTVSVDFDLGEQALGLLGALRLSSSNKTVPAIAITRHHSELALAYCAGTNFVLQKPLDGLALNRMLSAGYGLVVRELRRYFRCRVKIKGTMLAAQFGQRTCQIVNISEGGMEIVCSEPKLTAGTGLHIEFSLPDGKARFKVPCETRWRNARGHAGVRFLLMPLGQRCDLQRWIADRLEDGLPESVAERFRSANNRLRSGDRV